MGFLDHSTNNIIVDAVLTDYGRSKLANQGANAAALVQTYAFADDEVDYSMITKYGVQVGKEKIEKNTPIFEASTNAAFAVKFQLKSVENSSAQQVDIQYNPNINKLTKTQRQLILPVSVTDPDSQGANGGIYYMIEYDTRFVTISGPGDIKTPQNRPTYLKHFVTKALTSSPSFTVTLVDNGQSVLQETLGVNTGATQLRISTSEGTTDAVTIQLDYSS